MGLPDSLVQLLNRKRGRTIEKEIYIRRSLNACRRGADVPRGLYGKQIFSVRSYGIVCDFGSSKNSFMEKSQEGLRPVQKG